MSPFSGPGSQLSVDRRGRRIAHGNADLRTQIVESTIIILIEAAARIAALFLLLTKPLVNALLPVLHTILIYNPGPTGNATLIVLSNHIFIVHSNVREAAEGAA